MLVQAVLASQLEGDASPTAATRRLPNSVPHHAIMLCNLCLKCVCFGGLLLGPDVLHKLDRGSISLDHCAPLTSASAVDVPGWESVAPVRSSLQLRGYRLNRSGNGYEGRPLLHEGYRPSSSSGVGEVLPQISTQQLIFTAAGASAPSAPHAAGHFIRGRGLLRCRTHLGFSVLTPGARWRAARLSHACGGRPAAGLPRGTLGRGHPLWCGEWGHAAELCMCLVAGDVRRCRFSQHSSHMDDALWRLLAHVRACDEGSKQH